MDRHRICTGGMGKIWFVFFATFFLIGCSSLGKKLTNEHALNHQVEIVFNEKNKIHLRYTDISHRIYEEQVYLVLSGAVKKPQGRLAAGVLVDMKFTDKDGQILVEEKKKAFLHRAGLDGGPAHRRQEASFHIKVPDNHDIAICTLTFVWI